MSLQVAFRAWRLCISLDELNHETVSLSYTYSRPCSNLKGHAALYADSPVIKARLVDDIPKLITDELEGLGSLARPFDVTHHVEEARKDILYLLSMEAQRGRYSEFGSKETIEKCALPAVLIGNAAHHVPRFLGESENHAIADAVQLGDLIAAAGEEESLRSVSWRFIIAAYRSRWLRAMLAWEHEFCSFHRIDSPMNHSWRVSNPRCRSPADRLDKMRSFRPEDSDEELARLQNEAQEEWHTNLESRKAERIALSKRRNASSGKARNYEERQS